MTLCRPATAKPALVVTSGTSLSISVGSDVLALDLICPAGGLLLGLITITFLGKAIL